MPFIQAPRWGWASCLNAWTEPDRTTMQRWQPAWPRDQPERLRLAPANHRLCRLEALTQQQLSSERSARRTPTRALQPGPVTTAHISANKSSPPKAVIAFAACVVATRSLKQPQDEPASQHNFCGSGFGGERFPAPMRARRALIPGDCGALCGAATCCSLLQHPACHRHLLPSHGVVCGAHTTR
jgi:hypothetical protein